MYITSPERFWGGGFSFGIFRRLSDFSTPFGHIFGIGPYQSIWTVLAFDLYFIWHSTFGISAFGIFGILAFRTDLLTFGHYFLIRIHIASRWSYN